VVKGGGGGGGGGGTGGEGGETGGGWGIGGLGAGGTKGRGGETGLGGGGGGIEGFIEGITIGSEDSFGLADRLARNHVISTTPTMRSKSMRSVMFF